MGFLDDLMKQACVSCGEKFTVAQRSSIPDVGTVSQGPGMLAGPELCCGACWRQAAADGLELSKKEDWKTWLPIARERGEKAKAAKATEKAQQQAEQEAVQAEAERVEEEKLRAAQEQSEKILLTCGEFKQDYEIIDVISVVSSAQGARRRPGIAGLFESDGNEAARQMAFEEVKGQARLQAAFMEGDGVQNIQFSHAKAMTQAGGLSAGQHIWTFFAYGTVVKFT